MKRIYRAGSVLFLVWMMAAGCARPTPERKAVVITFACRDYLRDWYAGLAQEFHKEYPDIQVEILSEDEILGQTASSGSVTVTGDEIHQLARAADTFSTFAPMLGERPQDVALDLNELAAHDGSFSLDDLYPAARALVERGEHLWGLPFNLGTLMIYYNPALFEAAGVPYPEAGWTWDDLLAAAVQLTKREGDIVRRWGYVDRWGGYTLPLLAYQRAGALVETRQEVPQARLDNPVVAAVEWYAGLVTEHGVMPDPVANESSVLQAIIYDHAPAMWVGFAHEWDNFSQLYDARAVPLPAGDVGAAHVSASAYVVSAGTAYPREAWRWIEYLSRQPPLYYGPRATALPGRQSAVEENKYWSRMDDDLVAVFQYNLEHAVDVPRPVMHGLLEAFDAVLSGTAAEAALIEAQDRANQALIEAAAQAAEPGATVVVAAPQPTPTPGGVLIHFGADRSFATDWTVYDALAQAFVDRRPGLTIEVAAGSESGQAAADCALGLVWEMPAPAEVRALDPLLAADPDFDPDRLAPFLRRQVEAEGALWALPLDASPALLYYNCELFDRLGLSYPTADWTPEQLIERAIELTDADAPQPVYGFYPRDGAYADAPRYVAWLGGQLFDQDGYPSFDHPSTVQALADYVRLILEAAPPAARELHGDRWHGYTIVVGGHPALVGTGQVAMWIDGYAYHQGAPPLPFVCGVSAPPAGAAPLAQPQLRALTIGAQTAQPEACWAWLSFLSAQPEAAQWLPARLDVTAGEEWREQVGAEVAGAWQAILARDEALPPQSRYDAALYWFEVALAAALDGISPAEALAEAQTKAVAYADCMAAAGTGADWRACALVADPDAPVPTN